MHEIRDLSIKWNVLVPAFAAPVFIGVLMAWQRTGDIRANAEKTVVDKSRAVVLMAEASRDEETSANAVRLGEMARELRQMIGEFSV